MHRSSRRGFVLGAGATAAMLPFIELAHAAGLGGGLTNLLGQASDTSLEKLAQPGAFYKDKAVRVLLPMAGGSTGRALASALKVGSKLGLTRDLTRSINDAAGLAAREAKPVFRAAISGLSLRDVPGILQQNDGATQYLRRSAGTELGTRLRPLIDTALGQVGAFNQLDALSQRSSLVAAAGLSRDRLGASVSEQALAGIFKYIGAEEGKLRADPLGPAAALLKGLL